MKTYHFKICRLYFNRRDDPAGCWSVDSGPGTEEMIGKWIIFWVRGETAEDLSQHGPNGVAAWVLFKDVDVTVIDGGTIEINRFL
jgi:hypothetical protein